MDDVLHNNKGDSNNLLDIYINIFSDIKNYKDVMTIGISAIDLSTGKSIIYDAANGTWSGYGEDVEVE